MSGVPYTFANASTSIPLSQLDSNFQTPVTIGNASVALGNTITTIGNVTLANATISGSSLNNSNAANVTITNYTETYATATGNVTIALGNGTFYEVTTNNATTITLPNSVQGKSFTVIVSYNGANTVSWTGGSTLKWAGNSTPTPTSVNGKYDIFNFYQDGTNTYGSVFGQNY